MSWYTIMRAIGRVGVWSEWPEESVKVQNNGEGDNEQQQKNTYIGVYDLSGIAFSILDI